MGTATRTETDASNHCPRCERYLAEVPVVRAATGDVAHVCRACARTLDGVEGIDVLGLDGRAYGDGGYGVDEGALHEALHERKYVDGQDEVVASDFNEQFEAPIAAIRHALTQSPGVERVRECDPYRYRITL